MMKQGLTTIAFASVLAGAASLAFAGTYGEPALNEEGPAPVAEVPALESEPRILREFAGFLTDAETTRGFWVELGSGYASETDLGPDIDLWTLFARLAVGGEMWEVGAQLPYSWAESGIGDEDGLNDMHLWGKVLPIRTDVVTAGGGLVVSAPTGDSPLFSADEWGFNPFLTSAFAAGPVSIRTMIGYDRYIDITDSDAMTYNASVLAPVGDMVVVRAEFAGYHGFDTDLDPVSFVPGVDVVVPLGNVDLWIRATGAAGLTDEAADWELALSLALTRS
ncbi:MAG: hypothetical protein ABR538_07920 [Candidatus Binatia bacterium]